jgi:PAS domain S-box-containing protein
MKVQNSKAPDLFLLLVNLSRLTSRKKIIDVFVKALKEIWPDIIVFYQKTKSGTEKNIIEISASDSNYGYICIDHLTDLENEDLGLLHNAAAMLAIILKKNEQDKLLADDRVHLQKLVDEKICAIKESEKLFSAFFQASPIAISITRLPDGKVNNINPTFIRMFGYTPEEVINHTTPELKLWANSEDRVRMFKLIGEQGEVQNFEAQYSKKSGEIGTLLVSAVVIKIEDEQYLLSMMHDITERKQVEESLRDSERKFRETVIHLDEGYYSVTLDGLLLEHNQAFNRILGFDSSVDLKGNNLLDFWQYPDERREYIQALTATGSISNYQINAKTKTGDKITVLGSAHLIKDKNNRPLRIEGIFLDITERKRAEEALRVSLEKYRVLFESFPIGITITDKSGKIIEANRTSEQLLGVSRETQIERTYDGKEWVIIRTDGTCMPADEFASVIALRENRLVENVEMGIVKDKSDITWIRVTAAPIPLEEYGVAITYNDITKRKRAEESLRESEEKWRSLVAATPDYISLLDPEGRILFLNHFAEGFTEKDVIGSSVFKYLSPDSIEIFKKKIEECLSIRTLQKFEHNAMGDRGVMAIYEDYIIPLHDNNEEINFMVISRDITERKRAEEALRALSSRHEAILEAVPDIIMEVDSDKVYTWANCAGLEFFGEDVVGREARYYFEGEQATYDKVQPLFAGDESIIYIESWQRRKDGKKRLLAWWCRVLKDENERVTGALSTARDITERKLAEEELAEEQYLMNALMNNIPDNIYFKDRASRFIRISKAQAQMFGLSDPEQAVGKTDFDFFTEEHARQAYDDEQTIIRTGNPLIKEEKETWANRPDTWALTTKMPLSDKEGSIIGTFGISIDITERKHAEEALIKAKDKAEESDRLKTAFLHNISHEIRTPMNAIVGFSGFLNRPGLLPEKRKHFTDIIVKSSNQLLSIITDIISIATVEAGQAKIEENEINLNATFKLVFTQFALIAQNKKVDFKYIISLPDDEATVITDETKLTEVLTNLVGNALKFTKQGYVNFGYKVKDNELECFVEDTGIGIPPEMHEEIFKRFRQVESTIIRQFGGSGLGLSISKAYVELLGGKMRLLSELEKGSVFYFTIPYKKAISNELSDKQPSKVSLIEFENPGTLLIAEDEDSNFMLLEELLSEININIIRAINGLEAIEICKTNKNIDLVLMDIKMPVMDGYEATKQIREFMPDLPIIAQTAYTTDIDKNKAFACGCTDFISKPIKQELLISTIKELLKKT